MPRLSPPRPKKLPKPRGEAVVILPNGEPEKERIPGRVYVTKEGIEVPWLDDRNPRVWLGAEEED